MHEELLGSIFEAKRALVIWRHPLLHIPFELPPHRRILWAQIMETAPLLISFLFSTFGLGYFVYGKKQANWIAMVDGVGLMLFPYFVSNVWIMIAVGLILMALPYVFRDYA